MGLYTVEEIFLGRWTTWTAKRGWCTGMGATMSTPTPTPGVDFVSPNSLAFMPAPELCALALARRSTLAPHPARATRDQVSSSAPQTGNASFRGLCAGTWAPMASSTTVNQSLILETCSISILLCFLTVGQWNADKDSDHGSWSSPILRYEC